MKFTASESKTVYLCACKQTKRAVLRRFAQIAVIRADGGLAVIRILPVTE